MARSQIRIVCGPARQKTNPPHPRLLRPRRHRPRCGRATNQRDELASFHSITSSARASSEDGISMPMAWAAQIDNQFELSGLFDRQIGGLGTLANLS